MRYDRVRSRDGFDILDAAEIWPRADAAGWAALAEMEAAWTRTADPRERPGGKSGK